MALTEQETQLEVLMSRVIKWAEEKGILDKATPQTQFSKFLEEYKETWDAIISGDEAEIIDGIGDTAVTIIIHHALSSDGHWSEYLSPVSSLATGGFFGDGNYAMAVCLGQMSNCAERPDTNCYEDALSALHCVARHYDFDLNHCLEAALDVIEKRTGRMINGVFVKDQHNELLKD